MSKQIALPCTRFVRQVSNGASRSKYAYTAMQAENAEALRDGSVGWRLANIAANMVALTVNQLTATDGVRNEETGEYTTPPTYTVYLQDRYDAFKQAGDAVPENATMCGYAGLAAYRFELATSFSDSAIDEVSLMISRDRYLRSGVRVALALSDDQTPSDDWSVIRGEAAGTISTEREPVTGVVGVSSRGYLDQVGVPYLLAGRSFEGRITFRRSEHHELDNPDGKKFLWIYVSLEDYEEFWTDYSADDPRSDYIEGSAMLVQSSVKVTFHDDDAVLYNSNGSQVSGWTLPNCADVGGDSNLDRVNALGNFCNIIMGSQVYFPNGIGDGHPAGSNTVWAVTFGMLDSLRTTPLLAPFDAGGGTYHVQAKDMCTLGAQNAGHRLVNNSVTGWVVASSLGVEILLPKSGSQYLKTGEVTNPIRAHFGFGALVVPSGARSYGTVALVQNMRNVHYGNMSVGLNIWRSKSPDLVGPYGNVACAALAQNPAFYTGSKTSISGSITGDGTATEGVTVEAQATLVGYADCDNWASSDDAAAPLALRIRLSTPVSPGDVLIVSPRVLALTPDTNSEGRPTSGLYATFSCSAPTFRFFV